MNPHNDHPLQWSSVYVYLYSAVLVYDIDFTLSRFPVLCISSLLLTVFLLIFFFPFLHGVGVYLTNPHTGLTGGKNKSQTLNLEYILNKS